MTDPSSTIALLKQAKDALPVVQSLWAKVRDANERDGALRVISFMEGKRIFALTSFEVPYGCYRSAENIMAKIEGERDRLPNEAFRTVLLELIKVCNRFKTSLERMGLCESKQYEGQLTEEECKTFRKALENFRYMMGVQVAVIGQTWNVAVPETLIPYEMMRSLFPQLKTRPSTFDD